MKHVHRELEEGFLCPKCHAHGGIVHEISLGRVAVCLTLAPMRYVAVSCGQCGYTEFYLLNILEKNMSAANVFQSPSMIQARLSNANLSVRATADKNPSSEPMS